MYSSIRKRAAQGFALLGLATIPATLHSKVLVSLPEGDNICALSSLDLTKVTFFNDGGKNSVQANRSTFGNDIVMQDTTYSSGVGTHATSLFVVEVNGATSFSARLGIDDAADQKPEHGIVNYTVTAHKANKSQEILYEGTISRTDNKTVSLAAELADVKYLTINLDQGEHPWADHVDLGNAYFVYDKNKPQLISADEMWTDASHTIDLPEAAPGMENIPLSSLDISKATCGWKTNQANKSVKGNPIRLGDYTYRSGVGTHAPGQIIVKLNGSVTRFYSVVGIDKEANANAANAGYRVSLKAQDGQTTVLAEGNISGKDTEFPVVDVNVAGGKYLILEATNGTDGTNSSDHVDWANAYLEYQDQNSTPPIIVSADEIASKLATATTVFSQPGVRFMHKIKATNPDAQISVKNLPEGLMWNEERQLVEGIVENEGKHTYQIEVTADGETNSENVFFTISKDLQHPIPFMGWLSWNSVQNEISEAIVKKAVDLFKEKGLYECGWNTIMMDDWWHANERAANGKPLPNPQRFPNGLMPVSEYVHNNGMNFGLYTDAAEKTCAGAFGSYGYEKIDADQYAEWGIDVVKCDYCNAPDDVETAQKRYKALADAFKQSGRNIMLYICEWGVREPWKWGAEVGGACWRVSQDVRDCWTGAGSGVGVVQSIEAMKGLSAYQGVNRYNDADMLCTALHGTGKSSNDLCGGKGPGMTQDEYRTQFALWCMWSSPMALSFDPRSNKITEDDYAILKNKELIALNQDRMGQQADLIDETERIVAFAKDCENGDIALSVTNMSEKNLSYTFDFNKIPHLKENQEYLCRDLWQGKDLTPVTNSLTTSIRPHATQVFRLAKKDINVSVESIASAQSVQIKANENGVVIEAPQSGDMPKRILVSDLEGRVVANTTTCNTHVVMPVNQKGAYIVVLSCGAKTFSEKVIL